MSETKIIKPHDLRVTIEINNKLACFRGSGAVLNQLERDCADYQDLILERWSENSLHISSEAGDAADIIHTLCSDLHEDYYFRGMPRRLRATLFFRHDLFVYIWLVCIINTLVLFIAALANLIGVIDHLNRDDVFGSLVASSILVTILAALRNTDGSY